MTLSEYARDYYARTRRYGQEVADRVPVSGSVPRPRSGVSAQATSQAGKRFRLAPARMLSPATVAGEVGGNESGRFDQDSLPREHSVGGLLTPFEPTLEEIREFDDAEEAARTERRIRTHTCRYDGD